MHKHGSLQAWSRSARDRVRQPLRQKTHDHFPSTSEAVKQIEEFVLRNKPIFPGTPGQVAHHPAPTHHNPLKCPTNPPPPQPKNGGVQGDDHRPLADFPKPAIRTAHDRSDETLERIDIGRRFENDTERLEKLFEMDTRMTAAAGTAKKRKHG